MKLLVLSNVPGSTDLVVDALGDSNSVVAKEANIATDAMVSMASEQMKKRAYGKIIVIARDPIGAGIAMNKREGLDAAVCGSVEDVKLANENRANVIIIRDSRSTEFQEMLYQITQSGTIFHGLKLNVKLPQLQPKGEEAEKEAVKISEPRSTTARKEKVNEEEAQKEEAPEEKARTHGSKGVMGKLKDYLGIV